MERHRTLALLLISHSGIALCAGLVAAHRPADLPEPQRPIGCAAVPVAPGGIVTGAPPVERDAIRDAGVGIGFEAPAAASPGTWSPAVVDELRRRIEFLETQMTAMGVVAAVAASTRRDLGEVVRQLWRSDLFADDDAHPSAMSAARAMAPADIWRAVESEDRFWRALRDLRAAAPAEAAAAVHWRAAVYRPAVRQHLLDTVAELRGLGVPEPSVQTFARLARGA